MENHLSKRARASIGGLALAFALAVTAAGCGPSPTFTFHSDAAAPPVDADPLAGLASLEVAPPAATLTSVAGMPAPSADFTATGHFADGHAEDLTAIVGWSVDDPVALASASGHVVAGGVRGGQTLVRARIRTVEGTAMLTVLLQSSRTAGGAPPDAAGRFGGAADPALAPTPVYPPSGVLLPPNLLAPEFQWRKAGGTDLFALEIHAPFVDVTLYTDGDRVTPTREEWRWIAETARGAEVTFSLRATVAAGGGVGSAADQTLVFGEVDLHGGLYYWSTLPPGDPRRMDVQGIWRIDFGADAATPEKFYGQTDPPGLCVGCHVLSHDGARIGVSYSFGDRVLHKAAFLDVATKTPYVGVDQGLYSSFSAFSPDATRLVTNPATGVLTLRDGATGASLGDIPTGAGRAAQPDFSPDGQKLVYVGYAGNQPVWELSGGSLEVLDAAGGGFGAPTTVVAAQGSENNYYPQFSPDGDWILFNRVPSGSSYNNPAAEIWVVRADGSQPPVPLDAANQSAGLTNSWPRWAPVVQDYQGGHLLWLTVSSQRAYGLELAAGTRPQLWMMGFDPARAAAGMDPSWPAFWLPFQDLSSDNHIAQWTTQIVTVP